ncbi:DUF721 domain-containing protein [Rhizobium sp. L1K21]|uniref:DUF721 domain-containing protein n=1 Tax=Rhizobium sp. L1K21 TaxID=2954933 RepID=UPI0020938424|nr:DciA family protein [Rhizobium sp. L1K21]MCO6186793.1 DciA family protein [Rhizobium sp. L1K21]
MAEAKQGWRKRGPAPLADLANGVIDPVLSRRAGINTALLGSWDEIAGEDFADCTRPERITWPRRVSEMADEGYQPGVLTVACESARALFLTHAQGELIARINAFFGYPAIRQVRIVQKPVSQTHKARKLRPLDAVAAQQLDDMIGDMDDGKLKEALQRLGRGVLSSRQKR